MTRIITNASCIIFQFATVLRLVSVPLLFLLLHVNVSVWRQTYTCPPPHDAPSKNVGFSLPSSLPDDGKGKSTFLLNDDADDEQDLDAVDDDFTPKHIEERRKVYEKHFGGFPNFKSAKKYLIYNCETQSSCGGLSDRMKGIVQVYMLSILAKRRFAIHWTTDCALESVWEPNLLDWTFHRLNVSMKTATRLDYMTSYQSQMAAFEMKDLDPMTHLKDDVILVKSNQDWTTAFRKMSVSPGRFPQLFQHSASDLFRIVVHGLFKPTKTLKNAIQEFFATQVQDNKLACFHARMMAKEGGAYSLKDIQPVFEFLQQFNQSGHKIFVASDGDEVKINAQTLFSDHLIDTEGPLVHIDRFPDKPGAQCTGFFRVFVDLTVLSRCSTLVLTYSGYGLLASFLRHTSHDLYSFFNTHGVFPVSRHTSKTMYQYHCGSGAVVCPP